MALDDRGFSYSADVGGAAVQVLVLGLGNDLLGDDAVGLHVARAVRLWLSNFVGVTVRETTEVGLSLLDEVVGCERLLVVDAIETGTAPAGHVHEFDLDALAGRGMTAPHFVGLVETLAMGRAVGLTMPVDVRIFAVEVKDAVSIAERLSPEIEQIVAGTAERIAGCAIDLLRIPPLRRGA